MKTAGSSELGTGSLLGDINRTKFGFRGINQQPSSSSTSSLGGASVTIAGAVTGVA